MPKAVMDVGLALLLTPLVMVIVILPTFMISTGAYLVGDHAQNFFAYVGGRLLIAVGIAFVVGFSCTIQAISEIGK